MDIEATRTEREVVIHHGVSQMAAIERPLRMRILRPRNGDGRTHGARGN